ncbi:DUF5977 domain-containing protein [Hufsiella ginkgonis]|uniref:DUF5977 domain-containing protein n=1 Tax=Hufsiella ginkgonis TaxID=2695274 RepID=A0A7K1XU52_9SPHI|nr:DUF5977 domain-containing protein [Hufsiella ginkgonis]MXV14543.1 hypothetical protein [Hufsiella ginkgonis]
MVRGLPDEDANGYFGSTMGAQIEGTLTPAIIYSIIDNTKDAEPDLFYFSMNGMTGKFVFDKNKNPVMLPDNGVKILNSPFKQELGVNGWILSDLAGNRFLFGTDAGSIEAESTVIHGENTNQTLPTYNSSWMLRNIITSDGRETITYNYETGGQITTTNYRFLKKYRSRITSTFNRGLYFLGMPIIQSSTASDHSFVDTHVWNNNIDVTIAEPKYLSSIVSSDRSAYFSYLSANDRKDLLNGRVLEKIELRNNLNQTINTYKLFQTYFISPQAPTVPPPEFYRLRLDSICTLSSQSQLLPLYRFGYNSTVLPTRTSVEMDHWGYYNYYGQPNRNPFPNFPDELIRQPTPERAQGSMLERITYAAGGYKKFVFELNQYHDLQNNITANAGGLRVALVIDVPGLALPPVVARYKYTDASGKSTGMLLNQLPVYTQYIDHDQSMLPYLNSAIFEPVFAPNQTIYSIVSQQKGCLVYPVPMKSNLMAIVGTTLANFMGVGSSFSSTMYGPFIIQSNISLNNLFDTDGSVVGYSEVTVDNGKEGKTVNKFTDVDDYPDYSGQMRVDHNYNVVKRLLPNASPYTPATSYAFARGKLKESLVYDSRSVLLKRVTNTYGFHSLADSVRALRCAIGKISVFNGSNWQTYTNTYFNIGYYFHVSKSLLLISTKEEHFLPGNGMVETGTAYTYHAAIPALVTKLESTNSDGLVSSTNYKYVIDKSLVGYTEQAHVDGANQLYANGRYGILLEQTQINNGLTTGIKKTGFKTVTINSRQLTLPEVIYEGDGRGVRETTRFEKYDEFGNVMQAAVPGGSRMTTVWDSYHLAPVAECQNAALTDVFFEDFETLPGATSLNAFTGDKYWAGDYTLNFTPQGIGPHKLSYWYRENGTWRFSGYVPYTGTSASLTAGDAIDQVRVAPYESAMVSYTYDAVQGVSSVTDDKAKITRFSYDDFNRLTLVRDEKGNILKQQGYYYHTKPVDEVYLNAEVTASYSKNDCAGGVGIPFNYTIPIGLYYSYASQQDADVQATADLAQNGQAVANQAGDCGVFARLEIVNNSTNYQGDPNDHTTVETADIYVRFYTNASFTTPASMPVATDVKLNISNFSTDEYGSSSNDYEVVYIVNANNSSVFLGNFTLSWVREFFSTYANHTITESSANTYSLLTYPGSKYLIQ